MPLQLLTIARNTFVESIRQPIFFILVFLSGILQWLNTWGTGFSMGSTTSAEVSGDNKLLLDIGLATVFVCGMILAAFAATAVISREIENKTVLTVVSKPIGRPAVVLGKFLGVAGAISLATIIMLVFLLMGIRHGVMSIASDTLDGPVLVLTFGVVALAVIVGIVTNYLYGWPFSQSCLLFLAPSIVIAYVLVLLISKKWEWQAITTDLKPQVLIGAYCVMLAIIVLTALATAVSTRLGQVMTILICTGTFLFGLLSNHFVGRHAFQNDWIGLVGEATPHHHQEASFRRLGDTYHITLEQEPTQTIRPGSPLYWGFAPNGSVLATSPYPPIPADTRIDFDRLLDDPIPPMVMVTAVDGRRLTIRNVGGSPAHISRPPQAGDYVFLQPTRVNPLAAAVWAIVPNMHYFWMIDAISQNSRIPWSHVWLVTLYGVFQTGALLSLGVVLFQRRDVG